MELLVIDKSIDSIAIDTTLLEPYGIKYRPKDLSIPLDKGKSVPQPEVKIDETFIIGACLIGTADSVLDNNTVEGTLCIKQEEVQRLLVDSGKIYGFGYAKGQ